MKVELAQELILTSPDPDRLAEFYRDFLGMEDPGKSGAGRTLAFGRQNLTLRPAPTGGTIPVGDSPGRGTLRFLTSSSLEEAARRLSELGVAWGVGPAGPERDFSLLSFFDPDGNVVEVCNLAASAPTGAVTSRARRAAVDLRWSEAAELEEAAALLNLLRDGAADGGNRRTLEGCLHVLFAAEHHLIAYGSLAPGGANHDQVSELAGEWSRGWVHGRLLPASEATVGYPFLRWNPAGPPVPAWLLASPGLPELWERLDAFEGSAYRRVLVPFHDVAGVRALGYVYTAPA